ncbi:hypothetical protein AVW16_01845 [Crenobacter luteus]|uniref:Porin domain-containing protein n=1 Tax=Crenobacter luteus TaxID=1452487 RepID=A0A161S4Q2_9NEIS|nr:hypothetical protein AVW16_01845 [Crenobacter luteus]
MPWLATACVAFAPAAHAEVTVYGAVDATFDSVKSTVSANPGGSASVSRVNSNSSLVGFKGREDLGNGVASVWQIESGVGVDSGGGTLGTRDTFVGLAAPWGTVTLGRLTGPARALGGLMDINRGATGIAANTALLGKLGNLPLGDPFTKPFASLVPAAAGEGVTQQQIGPFDNRWKNAIAYQSPAWNGLSAAALIGMVETGVGDPATDHRAKGYDLGLRYDMGAALFAATYTVLDTGASDSAPTGYSAFKKLSDWRVAAIYRLGGQSRVGFLYEEVSGDFTANAAGGFAGRELTQPVWYLSGVWDVGIGRVIGQYGQARKMRGLPDADGSGANHVAVGYEHDLSKRTLLKALYSRIDNGRNAAFDYGIGSVGGVGQDASVRGVSLGIRHQF